MMSLGEDLSLSLISTLPCFKVVVGSSCYYYSCLGVQTLAIDNNQKTSQITNCIEVTLLF